MITIGMLIREEFSDVIFNENSLNVDFGTQKGLINWIKSMGQSNKQKYPLLWCVIDSYDDIGTQYVAKVRFMVFFQTKQTFENKDRFELVYKEYINPCFEVVKKKLITSKNIFLSDMPSKVFKGIVDADNYGVDFEQKILSKTDNDFSTTQTNQTKSIAQDYLDCKYIDLIIKINKILC